MRQCNFKKPLEFNSFSQIFYCGMTRLRKTNLDVFVQCQHTRAILRVCLINIQKFNEISYCGMTRFRNVKLGVFRQYQNTKTILKKKSMGQNHFKKLSKFQLSNFSLPWLNEGKINSVRPDMTTQKSYSKKCWANLS